MEDFFPSIMESTQYHSSKVLMRAQCLCFIRLPWGIQLKGKNYVGLVLRHSFITPLGISLLETGLFMDNLLLVIFPQIFTFLLLPPKNLLLPVSITLRFLTTPLYIIKYVLSCKHLLSLKFFSKVNLYQS